MPEISYQELDSALQDEAGIRARGIFLIWGEEALCSRALEKTAAVLLPGGRRHPAFETLEGSDVNVPLAIERVGTYSLLSEGRIVLLSDSSLFLGRSDHRALLDKAAAAMADERMKQAANWLLKLLALENLGLDDASPKTIGRLTGADGAEADLAWVMDLVDYCRRQGLAVPADMDVSGVLARAVEKGFPRGNHLVVTCNKVRKTLSLYRLVKQRGLVIDCSVPGGARMADRRLRSQLLRQQAGEILSRAGKRMAPDALAAVEEMTGFDPRTFAHNLEKLISYAGQRRRITREDVARVLSRSRSDPVYTFTGAVFARRLDDALFYLRSLLAEGAHPLQLLAALVNQLRRLLLIKGFVESPEGACWRPGMPFSQFKSRVLPAAKAHDAALQETMAAWQAAAAGDGGGRGGRKKAPPADLLLLGRGASPYAVYMRFKDSQAFSMQELTGILQELRSVDAGLKMSAQSPDMLLEAAVVRICRPVGGVPGRTSGSRSGS